MRRQVKGDPHFEKKVGQNSEIRAASSLLHRHAELKARDRCGGGQVKVEARITEIKMKKEKKKFNDQEKKKMEDVQKQLGARGLDPYRPEANQAYPTAG
jgi:hypothetical protein